MRRRVAPTLGSAVGAVRAAAASVVPAMRPSRVRVPGLVEIGPGGERNPRFRLYDLSLGGFCFEGGAGGFHPGQRLRGSLEIVVDGISITMYVAFEVRSHDTNGRVGCRFDNPGPQEMSVLRQLVASRLNGHAIKAGELLRK